MKIVLVDGYNLFVRCFTTIDKYNSNLYHTGALYGVLQTLSSLSRINDYVFIIWDGENSGEEKRRIFPEYKQGRRSKYTYMAGMQDLLKEEQIKAHFDYEFKLLHNLLDHIPVFNVSIYGLEADDIIGHIASDPEFLKHKITIFSSDKDFYQLLKKDDSVIVEKKVNSYRYYRNIVEEFNILPENFSIARAITGDDKGDGIVGIKGIGFKTLVKHYPFLSDTEVTLDEFFEIVRETNTTKKQIILDHEDQIRKMFQIINLKGYQMKLSSYKTFVSNLNLGVKWDPLYFKLTILKEGITGDQEYNALISNFSTLKKDIKLILNS